MQPVYYDVAVSADGYISGVNEDISRFPHSGPIVDAYLERIQTYSVAVMGAATYRFGLKCGMALGANPYPHMQTVVFSQTLTLPDTAAVTVETGNAEDIVTALRQNADGPIYLCGGGKFAASLLAAGLITGLRLKRAPILLGGGTRLFDPPSPAPDLRMTHQESYPDGTLYQTFDIG